MKKSYVVLCMCNELLQGKKLNLKKCCSLYGISASTFRRYLALLRSFFWEQLEQVVLYDGSTQTYGLKFIKE